MRKDKRTVARLAAMLLVLCILTASYGCGPVEISSAVPSATESPAAVLPASSAAGTMEQPDITAEESDASGTSATSTAAAEMSSPLQESAEVQPAEAEPVGAFQYTDIPPFNGSPYAVVNSNVPYFAEHQMTTVGTERYSPLDALGRCGPAWASVGIELMPQDDRGDISSVTPSGWKQAKVDGEWLYNRCHLIGYQLTAEDARPQNLITGTRYLNIQGMLPFENMVADYVKETGNHVMYRATPIFEDNELVCRGVLMEGLSVEDDGDGVSFCIFAYNVQPGVELNYADGSILSSALPVTEGEANTAEQPQTPAPAVDEWASAPVAEPESASYIGNKNTGKFHRSDCSSVDDMKESNKVPLSSAAEALAEGYVPCKRCDPK